MKKISVFLLLLTLSSNALASFVSTPYPITKGGTGVTSQTASRAVTTDGSGNVVSTSATTSTEVGFLSGVTSAIQTQLNAKQSTTLTSTHLLVGNGSNVATDVAASGDLTLANTGAFTLATVNSNVGSFVHATVTVNAKGLVTAASAGTTSISLTVTNGGDAAYTILAADQEVRASTTLTAGRAYTLPACVGGNVGELHYVKNPKVQTFNITLTAAGADMVDSAATYVLAPGDSATVLCAVAAVWDIL